MPGKRVSFREQPNNAPVSQGAMRTNTNGGSNIGVASVVTTPAAEHQGYDPRQAQASMTPLQGHQKQKGPQHQYSAPTMLPGQQHVNLYGSQGGSPQHQMMPSPGMHPQQMRQPQQPGTTASLGYVWPMQPGAQGMMYKGHGQQAAGHGQQGHYDQAGHWVVDEHQFF